MQQPKKEYDEIEEEREMGMACIATRDYISSLACKRAGKKRKSRFTRPTLTNGNILKKCYIHGIFIINLK